MYATIVLRIFVIYAEHVPAFDDPEHVLFRATFRASRATRTAWFATILGASSASAVAEPKDALRTPLLTKHDISKRDR